MKQLVLKVRYHDKIEVNVNEDMAFIGSQKDLLMKS